MTGQIEIAHVRAYFDTYATWERDRVVYIGRRMGRHKVPLPQSMWANAFKLPENPTLADRHECLRNYARQFADQTLRITSLPKLFGCTLVCWCGGASLCHGHFLAAAAHLVPQNNRNRWREACQTAVEYAIAEHRRRGSGLPLIPTAENLAEYLPAVKS